MRHQGGAESKGGPGHNVFGVGNVLRRRRRESGNRKETRHQKPFHDQIGKNRHRALHQHRHQRGNADRAQRNVAVDLAREQLLEVPQRQLMFDRRGERIQIPERRHKEDGQRTQVDHAKPA
ncbi:MAG: hypothetical protein WCI74_15100, partial [Actinomycetes bacterium]